VNVVTFGPVCEGDVLTLYVWHEGATRCVVAAHNGREGVMVRGAVLADVERAAQTMAALAVRWGACSIVEEVDDEPDARAKLARIRKLDALADASASASSKRDGGPKPS
jgi:hypothetical protein